MFGSPYWPGAYWGKPYWPSGRVSEAEALGAWRIDRWQIGTPKASIALRELRSQVKTSLPLRVFTRDDYPLAGEDSIGNPIPIGFGPIRGATAYLIDSSLKKFKVFDHSVVSYLAFYDDDRVPFTPNIIDLVNGEFTWSAWTGESLFVDAVLEDDISVDIIKLLLTDTERGAGLPLTNLDTASTGKGFGVDGARLDHIIGTDSVTQAEVADFQIGLYMKEAKEVFTWIQQVAVAAYDVVYTDRAGLYQIKSWKPVEGEGLSEITDQEIIPGTVKPLAVATNPVTLARVRYREDSRTESTSVVEHSDDELRQLRGLSQHATLDKTLPLADRFGAKLWVERAVAMRGVPRRTVSLKVTQEHSTLEPGDYVRLVYSPLDMDDIWEVISSTIRPGTFTVDLTIIDVRGFGDGAGFWTEDSFNFPATLGGAAITVWDDAWTDAQKKWYRENKGVWVDDDGYADSANDPLWSFRGSRWV